MHQLFIATIRSADRSPVQSPPQETVSSRIGHTTSHLPIASRDSVNDAVVMAGCMWHIHASGAVGLRFTVCNALWPSAIFPHSHLLSMNSVGVGSYPPSYVGGRGPRPAPFRRQSRHAARFCRQTHSSLSSNYEHVGEQLIARQQ